MEPIIDTIADIAGKAAEVATQVEYIAGVVAGAIGYVIGLFREKPKSKS